MTRRPHGSAAPRLAAVVALLFAVVPIEAESAGSPRAGAVRRDELARRRADFVGRAAADLACAHPWAGEYRFACTGLVVEVLALTPDLGFARAVRTCQGAVGWQFGRVEVLGDRIVLNPESGKPDDFVELYPVRWGEDLLLVEPERLDELARCAARGEASADGWLREARDSLAPRSPRDSGTARFRGRPVLALTGEPLATPSPPSSSGS